MFKTKRKVTCLILVLALIFSMSGSVFAAAPEDLSAQSDVSIQNLASASIEFYRTGTSTAESAISADTYSAAEYIKVTATLQEYNYSTSTWSNTSGISPKSKTVYNVNSIYMVNTWTTSSSKTYRLKVVIEDKVGSVTTTGTFYSSSI